MPSLKLSNPFRRGVDRPSLKERAAALKATARRVMRRPVVLPAPGSEQARAAFAAACREHSRLTQFAHADYAELRRTPLEWWTKDSLSRARQLGEISAAECARLYPIASERELRLDAVSHRLNIGALHALAFADEYSALPAGEIDPHVGRVPELLALWERHKATSQGWDQPSDTPECIAANGAHHEIIVSAMAGLDLPPPTTTEGLGALALSLALAHEGFMRANESDPSERSLAAILTAVLHVTGTDLPADFEGLSFTPWTDEAGRPLPSGADRTKD